MSHRLVAVEDALRALDEAGPRSSDALARELGIHRLEARMVLLYAHWHGLVRATSRDEWAISDRGRQALFSELPRPSFAASVRRVHAAVSALAWRRRLRPGFIARGGVPLALGAVVCVAGVAVASSTLPIVAGPPTLARAHIKHHRHHRRHAPLRVSTLPPTTGITAYRRVEPSRAVVAVTHTLGVSQRRTQAHRRTASPSHHKQRAASGWVGVTFLHCGTGTKHHNARRC